MRDLRILTCRSVLHPPQGYSSLVIYGMSSIYALPRANKMWIRPVSVLLATFEPIHLEQGRECSTASVRGDFSSSQPPHLVGEQFDVGLALNAEMWDSIPASERY